MITLSQIQRIYGARLLKRRILNQWINNIECQSYIIKALRYELTDMDYNYLYQVGNWRGKYPGLNYLCTIYIHPLTKLQGLCQKIEKL